MTKAPAFQWYPKDCDTDEKVKSMDDKEFGFYIRCLNHAWLNYGLPAELPELARMMARSRAYVKKIWVRVGPCFVEKEGRYYNKTQEDYRAKHCEKSEAARAAAEERWHCERSADPMRTHMRTHQKRIANAMHCAREYGDSSSRSLESTTEQNTNRAREPEIRHGTNPFTHEEYEIWTDERCVKFLAEVKWKPPKISDEQVAKILEVDPFCFDGCSDKPGSLQFIHYRLGQFEEHFWPTFWRKVDKKAAREAWMKINAADESGSLLSAIMDGAERQRATMLAKEEQFRPHGATWINHARWNDQLGIGAAGD